jgi:adenosylcobinamide kinase/adenosylcobinamide-phosphate guanylyltransferase
LPSRAAAVSLSSCSPSSPEGFGRESRRTRFGARRSWGRRLAGYRRDQEARWKLIEAPELLWNALDPSVIDNHGALVIDRFTIWLSNHLAKIPKSSDSEFLTEIEQLADRLYRSTTPAVLVTTEIGLGFLPASVPDRRLINVAGLANQILAERAQTVVMTVSGVPLRQR